MTQALLLPCLLLLACSAALAYRVSRSEAALRESIADSFQDWETYKGKSSGYSHSTHSN